MWFGVWQAGELVQMDSYQEGRLGDALVDVYLHLDVLMASEDTRSELDALASRDQRGSGRCSFVLCVWFQ